MKIKHPKENIFMVSSTAVCIFVYVNKHKKIVVFSNQIYKLVWNGLKDKSIFELEKSIEKIFIQ